MARFFFNSVERKKDGDNNEPPASPHFSHGKRSDGIQSMEDAKVQHSGEGNDSSSEDSGQSQMFRFGKARRQKSEHLTFRSQSDNAPGDIKDSESLSGRKLAIIDAP